MILFRYGSRATVGRLQAQHCEAAHKTGRCRVSPLFSLVYTCVIALYSIVWVSLQEQYMGEAVQQLYVSDIM